jgi:hypothetical protein
VVRASDSVSLYSQSTETGGDNGLHVLRAVASAGPLFQRAADDGTPENNPAQNAQVTAIVGILSLNKDQRRLLHEEITGQNLDYQQILEIAFVAGAWKDKLRRHYPSRVFSVSVLSAEESGSVISVEFFEIR